MTTMERIAALEAKVEALHVTVDTLTKNQANLVELAKRSRARELEFTAVLDKMLEMMEDQSKSLAGLTVTVATLAIKVVAMVGETEDPHPERRDN